MLVLLLQLVLLRQLVLELPEIDDLADRRDGVRHDLHEIGFPLPGQTDGRRRSHDAKLAAMLIDDPDLRDPDLFVDASAFLLANGLPSYGVSAFALTFSRSIRMTSAVDCVP